MRTAMKGPVLTLMLTAAMPVKSAPILMACRGCQLPPPVHMGTNHQASVSAPSPLPFYDDLFRSGHPAVHGLTDRWTSHVFAADGGGFSLETVRRIARSPETADRISGPRDKLSAGSATLRYSAGISPNDMLSFGLTAGIEKRRFALDLARGHYIRSQSAGMVAYWSHGASWRLESGYRFDFGSRKAPMFERGIELAKGAPRSQRGAWTALSYTIGGSDALAGVSFGLRAQAFRITEKDRLALGASGRTDNRLAFTTSFRFR